MYPQMQQNFVMSDPVFRIIQATSGSIATNVLDPVTFEALYYNLACETYSKSCCLLASMRPLHNLRLPQQVPSSFGLTFSDSCNGNALRQELFLSLLVAYACRTNFF